MQPQISGDDLITARYGTYHKPHNIIMNDQIAGLLNHRSVRNFTKEPLPEGWVETLTIAAQSASTSSNLQQFSLVVVTDPKIKSEVRRLVAGEDGKANIYVEQAPAILLWVADMSRNFNLTMEDQGVPEVYDYLDSFLMASMDAALAAQNATIAAESLGLGVVYIGAARNKAKELSQLINLPRYSYVVCGLVIGWPDYQKMSSIRPRLPQSVVVHQDRYEKRDIDRYIPDYEKVFHFFREELGMKNKTWKQGVQVAATSINYMDGRQNLRPSLEEYGFGFK